MKNQTLPGLDSVLSGQVEYCRNSGIRVEMCRAFEWVEILDADDCSIFMQGDEAAQFIATIDSLTEQYPDADGEAIDLIAAYPYADLLGEG